MTPGSEKRARSAASPPPVAAPMPDDGTLVATAMLRAAEILGVAGKDLAQIIGVSPAFISKLRSGGGLPVASKSGELALQFIRLFRALDAITGGDAVVARAWMRNPNTALGARPIDHVLTVAGLIDTCTYLDQRRAIL